MKFKRNTVTAALPYANGPVHIGHLAGCYLPADIYVRFLKLTGQDTVFICGSDEHGVPITIKAKRENTTPQQVVDKYHNLMKKSFEDVGIAFDIYSRTSSPVHHETASAFFTTLYNKGVFKEEITEQYFDEKANQFLADRYIMGTCPKCGNENAYGDQCEKCGSSLNATDLINPRSVLSGEKPVLRKTKNWFLPLDQLQPKIEAYIDSHKDWKINVYGQCKSWLNQGLQPRAMTRDLNWGIKVPLKEAEGKVLYVWFDAPIGYISATKELLPKDWEKYWKDKESRLVHFIGKDNIVFHCIIFPSMLMEEGSFIVPDNVPANEFLNLEGEKISTSRNWAVWLHEYLIEFPNRQDELRYVLTSIAPETKDSDFSWKDYQARVNNELVAILGNFVNRAVVLTHKYFEGKLPGYKKIEEIDSKLFEVLKEKKQLIGEHISAYRFRDAQAEMMNIVRAGNKYLTETEPWKLKDEERIKTILQTCLQLCANLSVLMEPFLPFTAKKLKALLQADETKLKWNLVGSNNILPDGHVIGKAVHLFQPIADEDINFQLKKLEDSKKMNEANNSQSTVAPAKADISFEEFSKMDIRVGTILEAERVPKTDKLLKLLIDTGIDKRTVVSGIAQYYKPEEIIGRQVSILANLAPRNIKNITSQGMILMAENSNGELAFVSPIKGMENGAIVK